MGKSNWACEILGSMADVPDELLDQIKHLENIFTVDRAKLQAVTNHFVKELDKGKLFVSLGRDCNPNAPLGLSVEGGSIVSGAE